MILAFLFSIHTFLKQCKALRTEKYKRYINNFIIIIIYLLKQQRRTSINLRLNIPIGTSSSDLLMVSS